MLYLVVLWDNFWSLPPTCFRCCPIHQSHLALLVLLKSTWILAQTSINSEFFSCLHLSLGPKSGQPVACQKRKEDQLKVLAVGLVDDSPRCLCMQTGLRSVYGYTEYKERSRCTLLRKADRGQRWENVASNTLSICALHCTLIHSLPRHLAWLNRIAIQAYHRWIVTICPWSSTSHQRP